MLIAIILCLFSAAHGVPYVYRVDAGAAAPVAVGNVGSFVSNVVANAVSAGVLPKNFAYNTVRFIPNPAYNLPYYRSQEAYAPQYQQQVPVSGVQQYVVPNARNDGDVAAPVSAVQSAQKVYVVNANNQQQAIGYLVNPQIRSDAPVVLNSFQPFIDVNAFRSQLQAIASAVSSIISQGQQYLENGGRAADNLILNAQQQELINLEADINAASAVEQLVALSKQLNALDRGVIQEFVRQLEAKK